MKNLLLCIRSFVLDIFSTNKYTGVRIHPTAVIDGPCTIGEGTSIWHFSHLYKGCSIGPRSIIGQNVMIGPHVQIGSGCKIQNNVSLYEGVIVEDDVFCGPSCVFTNVINPRSPIDRKHEFRKTTVCRGASIGANATLVCGITIGEYAFVGAGAVVTTDVGKFEVIVGNPAKKMGYMCKCGEMLPKDSWTRAVCHQCGEAYQINPQNQCESTSLS
ncbi:DapH/DapD/GlmU-related protein [Magnetovibrio sp. PR-2]|uniref:DapH/DapD/GlmU-related protein n=1 Tax=Magnetovibrio sp. PR-2 TaxID=3120356 RepID=UPI002FCE681B